MLQDAIHRVLRAVDEIHNTFWEADLLDELHNELHRHRNFFRGLDDISVSGCESIRQIPERNHAREVEWRDRGTHTQWLTDHQLIDTRGYILNKFPFHHH